MSLRIMKSFTEDTYRAVPLLFGRGERNNCPPRRCGQYCHVPEPAGTTSFRILIVAQSTESADYNPEKIELFS